MNICSSLLYYDGEGNGTPLQYSCLENPMEGGAWRDEVHGVAQDRTQMSNFTFTFHFHALEKEMATHSSVLAWRIPGTGEPGGLSSMGSHRVGHDWSDLAAAAATVLWIFTHCYSKYIIAQYTILWIFTRYYNDEYFLGSSFVLLICLCIWTAEPTGMIIVVIEKVTFSI